MASLTEAFECFYQTNAQEIIENLFLGDVATADNERWLMDNNIVYILNVGAAFAKKHTTMQVNGINVMFVEITDDPSANIGKFFNACHDFIDQSLSKSQNILVHCAAGVSRSATIVISYLMHKKGMSMEEAYAFVQKKRQFINPNKGFLNILKQYDDYLFNSYKKNTLNGSLAEKMYKI